MEREKELMKLNETLNQKCAITLAARAKVSKVKKPTTTTATKATRNAKRKSDSTKINSFALADANKPSDDKRAVAVSRNGNGNGNEIDQPVNDVANVEMVTDTDTTHTPDNRDPIEKFLADFTVESKIKLSDNLPEVRREIADATAANENAKPTNGISLIPNNLVRRNVSTDGIIR